MNIEFKNKEKIVGKINEIEVALTEVKQINFEKIEFNEQNLINIMNNSNLITELFKKVYDLQSYNSVMLKNSSAGTDELKVKLMI